MTFKIIFTLFSVYFIASSYTHAQNAYINPQGSYHLVSKTKKVKGETYGRFGAIRVNRISDTEIYFELEVSMGATAYNNGYAGGNLAYKNNQAVYITEYDATCIITMTFSKKGITLVQKADDINMACGFGHAVYADGFYKKTRNPPLFCD